MIVRAMTECREEHTGAKPSEERELESLVHLQDSEVPAILAWNLIPLTVLLLRCQSIFEI